MADGRRQPRRRLPDLAEQRGALLGVRRVEHERRVEPGQEVADLVGAGAVLERRDPEHREPLWLGARPAREELAHRRVQAVVGEPRLHEVVVDLAEHHRGHDRVRRRVVALDEQDPLGGRMQPVGARQELDAGRPGQLLVGDHERHPLVLRRQRLELGDARLRAGGGDDAGVVAETAAQVGLERPQDGSVGRCDEDDRPRPGGRRQRPPRRPRLGQCGAHFSLRIPTDSRYAAGTAIGPGRSSRLHSRARSCRSRASASRPEPAASRAFSVGP